MKLYRNRSCTKREELPTIEALSGGDAFTVIANGGAVYVRASGATGKGLCGPNEKIGVVLTSGSIVVFPSSKQVFPVESSGYVHSRYGKPVGVEDYPPKGGE